jgi:hypothetical protein
MRMNSFLPNSTPCRSLILKVSDENPVFPQSQCSPARALQGAEAPLRIMISGAPASGKGTQCEMIVEQVLALLSNPPFPNPPLFCVCCSEGGTFRFCACHSLYFFTFIRSRLHITTLFQLTDSTKGRVRLDRPNYSLFIYLFILWQYNLAHIATGDLLRREVAAGTEAGKLAQDYMQKGQLVPNDIVVTV